MALRPVTARWFELLIARNELNAALQILAATGAVELQAHSNASAAPLLPVLRTAVDEYKRLAQRYREFWPPADGVAAQCTREPEEIPAAALRQLRAWAAEADPVIDRLQMLAQERAELERLQPLLAVTAGVLPNLHLFSLAGPILNSRAYLLAAEPRDWGLPSSVIVQHFRHGDSSYVLAIGPADQIAAFDETLGAYKARRLVLPAALLPLALKLGAAAPLGTVLADHEGTQTNTGTNAPGPAYTVLESFQLTRPRSDGPPAQTPEFASPLLAVGAAGAVGAAALYGSSRRRSGGPVSTSTTPDN